MKMINKIAHKINNKHGVRVLEELDLDSVETQQRMRAMKATFAILGNPDAYIDLSDRRVAFIFAVGYTVSFALARLATK